MDYEDYKRLREISTALDTGWWLIQDFYIPEGRDDIKDVLLHVHEVLEDAVDDIEKILNEDREATMYDGEYTDEMKMAAIAAR
jgi:hypothetical protein